MDPVVENGNYSILDILKRAYGEIQGEEYYKLWTEPLVTDQVGYSVIQST